LNLFISIFVNPFCLKTTDELIPFKIPEQTLVNSCYQVWSLERIGIVAFWYSVCFTVSPNNLNSKHYFKVCWQHL